MAVPKPPSATLLSWWRWQGWVPGPITTQPPLWQVAMAPDLCPHSLSTLPPLSETLSTAPQELLP